jgi:hypothetical protein
VSSFDPAAEPPAEPPAADLPTQKLQTGSVLDPPTVTTPPPAPQPGPVTAPDRAPARLMRLRTVIFGLMLLAVSVLSVIGATTEVPLSASWVAVAILVGAGFVLVAGGLSAALREAASRR